MADENPAEAQTTENTSLFHKLRNGEKHWAWKMGLRVIICVVAIIGIGVLAWLADFYRIRETYTGNFYGFWELASLVPGGLTVLAVSFVFSLICILVPLLRKTHRPVHPGVIVGIDLLIWLAFIVTGLFAIAAVLTESYNLNPGNYGGEYSSEYSGHYIKAHNGTWVYKITNVYSSTPTYHFNYTTGTYQYNHTQPSVTRHCQPDFPSCKVQDEYANRLFNTHGRREATEIVAAVTQWLNLILHFVLFVWACVDTNRRNSSAKVDQTQAVADRVIRDMHARGLITINDPGLARSAGAQMSEPARSAQPQPG